ncbi:MAG: glycosyltransferase, partial [Pseudomonadota bacterium]
MIREVLEKLSPLTSEDSIQQDRDRWLGHEHGPYIWTAEPGTSSFLFGAGSGLYPLLFARMNPGASLFVVEPDSTRLICFRDSLARTNLQNVHILDSSARGLEAMCHHAGRLGVVGVGLGHANREFLEAIQASRPMRVLFGEYQESHVDSLTLYETSRQAADHFHWLDRTNGGRAVGQRTPGPLLSLVVPVFDVARFLDRCLRSLAGQPLTSLEILLVDDGSRDGSGE